MGGVKGDREFNRAEIRAEVTTRLAHQLNNRPTDIIGNLLKLLGRQAVQIGRLHYRMEQRKPFGEVDLSHWHILRTLDV